jgi:large subunit ribosomal protein L25
MHEITLTAQRRPGTGKVQAKKLRSQGRVPAVVYGHGQNATSVTLDSKELIALFKSAGGENTIINLMLEDGSSLKTVIRETQTEPLRNRLLHLDLQEIKMDEKIRVKVPVETVGIPEGVKNQGGIMEHVMDMVEVSCLPGDIPDKIIVDISDLKVGQSRHVRDISLEKVEIVTDKSQVVATVIAPIVEEAAAPEAAAATEAKEPEVISKGKKEEEEEES